MFKTFALGDSLYGGLLSSSLNGQMFVSGHNSSVTEINSATNTIAKIVVLPSSPGGMTDSSYCGAGVRGQRRREQRLGPQRDDRRPQ